MKSNHIIFTLSEGEKVLRSYECTESKKWFKPKSIGYLTVTNKRLTYHREDHALMGKKTDIAEMPIDDVAGISSMMGHRINWILLFLFIIILNPTISFVYQFFNYHTLYLGIGFLFVLPYTLIRLIDSEIINKDIEKTILNKIPENPLTLYFAKKDREFFSKSLKHPFAIGIILLGWYFGSSLYSSIILSLFIKTAALILVYFLYFRHQLRFGLTIYSKTSERTSLNIRGSSFQHFYISFKIKAIVNPFASFQDSPSIDAETVIQELGAMITDVSLMGRSKLAKKY